MKIKVLNLYAGIGGNRKLWENVEVTAIEYNEKIARIYKHFFPDDIVIVDDAHNYLLNHFEEFDFIWSSPPCPTHSKIRKYLAVESGQNKPVFPDLRLYEEIIFLEHYFKGKWVVENVVSYYEPLIKPFESGMHYFWSNFEINDFKLNTRMHNASIEELQKHKGFDLSKFNNIDKRRILRNCVEPELGKFIFDSAFNKNQKSLNEW